MRALQRWRERRLLRRIRSGEREAAERLVDAHYEAVYRWALRLCRDREWAADLTQETFVQVWEGLEGFRGDATVKTWIHRIAYRTYLRAERGSRPAMVPLHDALNERTPTEAALTGHAVEAALAELPEKQRQVVALHYLQGFKVAEIGEVLGIPLGTVLSRLHTARVRLRELLGDELPGCVCGVASPASRGLPEQAAPGKEPSPWRAEVGTDETTE